MRAAFAFHRGNHAEGHFSDPAGRAAGTTKRLDLESSRFALDVPADAPASGGVAAATYVLFAGMIEFGLSIELIEIVTVTDARMGRILRRAGWPLRRVGKARPLETPRLSPATWRCRPMRWTASARRKSRDRCSGLRSFKSLPSFWEANVTAADRCGEPLCALKTYHAQARSHTSVTQATRAIELKHLRSAVAAADCGSFREPPSCSDRNNRALAAESASLSTTWAFHFSSASAEVCAQRGPRRSSVGQNHPGRRAYCNGPIRSQQRNRPSERRFLHITFGRQSASLPT